MLSIFSPTGIKSYPVSSDYNHKIEIKYEDHQWRLYIDAQFDGYSYYLEQGQINVCREILLNGKTIEYNECAMNKPGHELSRSLRG